MDVNHVNLETDNYTGEPPANILLRTTPSVINSSTGDSLLDGRPHPVDLVGFWIGVALSVSSSIFIGGSFIIKKRALLRLSKDGRRANQGGHGYLKDFLWWAGFLSMGVGEAANFIAYAFAPASLVSALGVLSVLVSTILASKYLKERLNILGKLGCFITAVGSTVIVIHAPMEKEIQSVDDLQAKMIDPLFILYVVFVVAMSLFLIYHVRPKCSETSTKTLLIWMGVCSMIGSLSVMFTKGVGLAFTVTFGAGPNQFVNWATWMCVGGLICCVTVQMNFLNKALDTFNTAVVTPIYYVFFTTCVITASAILFREFAYLLAKDWVGLFCGFFTVLGGIALLHFCKNYDITLEKLAAQLHVVQDTEKDDKREFGDLEFSDSSSGSHIAMDTMKSVDGRNYGALKMRDSICTDLALPKTFSQTEQANNNRNREEKSPSTDC